VSGLKPASVCHVRHAQKRLNLSRVQTTTSAKGPMPLIFALYVTECHGMSSTLRDRHGVSMILCDRFGFVWRNSTADQEPA
jgi:hypothetical protein